MIELRIILIMLILHFCSIGCLKGNAFGHDLFGPNQFSFELNYIGQQTEANRLSENAAFNLLIWHCPNLGHKGKVDDEINNLSLNNSSRNGTIKGISPMGFLVTDWRSGNRCVIALYSENPSELNLESGSYSTKSLVELFERAWENYKKSRTEIKKVNNQYEWICSEMNFDSSSRAEKQFLNLITLTRILEDNGWVMPDILARLGNSALCLILKYGDQNTKEKFLLIMREAAEKGVVASEMLAVLEDRVALGQGKYQTYGSQIGSLEETGEYVVYPLKNPKTVNSRREMVGLEPIEDYIANWDMTWDVQRYREILPTLVGQLTPE